MKKLLRTLCLVGVFALLNVNGASAQIKFKDVRYGQALKDGAKSNQYILLDFTATWCGPCKLMERTTFKDSTLGAYVNKKFIPIKIDTDHSLDKHLSGEFNVSGIPTLIVIDPKTGQSVLRMVGYTPADRLLKELQNIKK